MAVILMEIAGEKYNSGRFYPTFSGVLKSINFYPVSYMKREEGVCYLALGFGKTIVDGGKCQFPSAGHKRSCGRQCFST